MILYLFAFRFNYVNVYPQWERSNKSWVEIEEAIRTEMAKNSYSRRVIVSGCYGVFTLPDEEEKEQKLFLVVPEKHVAVPKFLWKLVYDADDGNNSVVYISLNNPYEQPRSVDDIKLQCDDKPCPAEIKTHPGQMLYCCDIESFQDAYGKFDLEVFEVPPKEEPAPAAAKHVSMRLSGSPSRRVV